MDTNNKPEQHHVSTQRMILHGDVISVLRRLQIVNNLKSISVMGLAAEKTWLALNAANLFLIQTSTALTWKHTSMKGLSDVVTAQAPLRVQPRWTSTFEFIWLREVWVLWSLHPDMTEWAKNFIFEIAVHLQSVGLSVVRVLLNIICSVVLAALTATMIGSLYPVVVRPTKANMQLKDTRSFQIAIWKRLWS